MAFVIPPWQGPDEPRRFEYIRLLVDMRDQLLAERRLLRVGDESPAIEGPVIDSLFRNHFWEYQGRRPPETRPRDFYAIWGEEGIQLHRPSLYYFPAAALVAAFPGQSVEGQLLLIRLTSVVFSAATVIITYITARRLFPDDRFIRLASAALVATLPMHIFMGGMLNNDNLLTLVGGFVSLALVAAFRRGVSVRTWSIALLTVVITLATKRAAVGLLPAFLAAVIVVLFSKLRGRTVRLGVVATLFITGTLATLLLIPYNPIGALAREALPLVSWAQDVFLDYTTNGNGGQLVRLMQVSFIFRAPDTTALLLLYVDSLFRSFWGIFGWWTVPLDAWLYAVLALGSVACIAGFFLWLVGVLSRRGFTDVTGHRQQLAGVFILCVSIASVAMLAMLERLGYYDPRTIPQGRYLFVVMTPIAILYGLGASTLLPPAWRAKPTAIVLTILTLIALDVFVYVHHIMPAFVTRTFS